MKKRDGFVVLLLLLQFIQTSEGGAFNLRSKDSKRDVASECADEAKAAVHRCSKETQYNRKSGYGRYPANGLELQMAEAGATKYRALELLYARAGSSGRIEDRCSTEELATIERESGCEDLPEYDCNAQQLEAPFRSFDGSCNNKHQFSLGAALTTFDRLLPADYTDRFNTPKGANPRELLNGFPMPSARAVSNIRLSSEKSRVDNERNDFEMIWGQFLDHDLDKTLASSSRQSFATGVLCNETCEYSDPCFPIPVPKDDPVRAGESECMQFTRTSPACNIGKHGYARELINSITTYIDGSQIYGSDKEIAARLRDGQTGELLNGAPSPFSGRRKPLLAVIEDVPADCIPRSEGMECVTTGDSRVNENIYLTSLHTVFHREHNRLVKKLRNLNPHWSGIRLYEEARKIVGAIIQKITIDEYLPKILGPKGASMIGIYEGYNPKTSPSITVEFSTAAFRFGHGTVGDSVAMLKKYTSRPETITFDEAAFNPELLRTKGLDLFIRGMVAHGTKEADPNKPIDDSMRENMFKPPTARFGSDLGSLNVQRGRDLGLAPYIEYVKNCGLGVIKTWHDLMPLIKGKEVLDELRRLYGHPGNIDLFAGGMSERLVSGGKVGPTFRCIIAETMKRVREGDRFWYENFQFSKSQLRELKANISPARIFCDNGDNIRYTPKDVWRLPSKTNPIVPCSTIPSLDLTPWKEVPDKSWPAVPQQQPQQQSHHQPHYQPLIQQQYQPHLQQPHLQHHLHHSVPDNYLYNGPATAHRQPQQAPHHQQHLYSSGPDSGRYRGPVNVQGRELRPIFHHSGHFIR